MARYRIAETGPGISIELTAVGDHSAQLLAAFSDCRSGSCSCPSNEYEKLARLEVEQTEDAIRLRLDAKPGEKFDTSKIAACLEYTTAEVAEDD